VLSVPRGIAEGISALGRNLSNLRKYSEPRFGSHSMPLLRKQGGWGGGGEGTGQVRGILIVT
jgi:hypothetical protein